LSGKPIPKAGFETIPQAVLTVAEEPQKEIQRKISEKTQ
jgi:hypothetical protein